MQDAKSRDAVTKRAQAALKKWPTLDLVPEAKGDALATLSSLDAGHYAHKVYEACAEGNIKGRDGLTLVGDKARL